MEAPYRHIACCVDRSAESDGVLRTGRGLRALGPGALSIVHVAPSGVAYAGYPGVDVVGSVDLAAEAKMWLDATVAANPGSAGVLLEGYAPAAVCDWAEQAGVDLLIAAAHRGLVERVLLGSFAGYLIRHAHCPVLLTRLEEPDRSRSAGAEAA